jgi:hypothetical protein
MKKDNSKTSGPKNPKPQQSKQIETKARTVTKAKKEVKAKDETKPG